MSSEIEKLRAWLQDPRGSCPWSIGEVLRILPPPAHTEEETQVLRATWVLQGWQPWELREGELDRAWALVARYEADPSTEAERSPAEQRETADLVEELLAAGRQRRYKNELAAEKASRRLPWWETWEDDGD
jgi:hypothetical protein